MDLQIPEHPLLARKFSHLYTLDEWKQQLDAATHVETLHGLLHVGFKIPERDKVTSADRLWLYLSFADGHSDSDTFRRSRMPESYSVGPYTQTTLAKGWPENTLRVVAQKAFVQLCVHVFKQDPKNADRIPGDDYDPAWTGLFRDEACRARLLWFLRLRKDYSGRRGMLHNDAGWLDGPEVADHHLQTFRGFALEVARLLLRNSGHDRFDWGSTLEPYKPEAISILHGLGKLDLLLSGGYCHGVDGVCRTRLKELALEMEVRGRRQSRKAATLQEACLEGSQAARVSLLLDVMRKEQARRDEIEKAEQQREEAERRLAALKISKK